MSISHAVPVEMVLRVRSFDTEFYKSPQAGNGAAPKSVAENVVKSERGKLNLEGPVRGLVLWSKR